MFHAFRISRNTSTTDAEGERRASSSSSSSSARPVAEMSVVPDPHGTEMHIHLDRSVLARGEWRPSGRFLSLLQLSSQALDPESGPMFGRVYITIHDQGMGHVESQEELEQLESHLDDAVAEIKDIAADFPTVIVQTTRIEPKFVAISTATGPAAASPSGSGPESGSTSASATASTSSSDEIAAPAPTPAPTSDPALRGRRGHRDRRRGRGRGRGGSLIGRPTEIVEFLQPNTAERAATTRRQNKEVGRSGQFGARRGGWVIVIDDDEDNEVDGDNGNDEQQPMLSRLRSRKTTTDGGVAAIRGGDGGGGGKKRKRA